MIPSPRVVDQPGPPPNNIGLRQYMKRSLLCKLAPIMGSRATGVALVRARGTAAVVIPGNAYAVPIIGTTTTSGQSQTDYSRLVKVGTLPATGSPIAPPSVIVDPVAEPSGTLVPIFAALGGSYYNASELGGVAPGTGLEWSPAIPDIEAVSLVAGTGMSGGIDLLVTGALKRIVLFDRMGLVNLSLVRSSLPAELWRSKLGDFPAGILALMGTKKSEPGGRGMPIHELMWRLHVITSRVDETERRYEDGDTTLDWAGGLLEDSGEVDGQAFSVPRIEVGPTRLMVADDGSFVHTLDFSSFATFDRIEPRTFARWLETQFTEVTDPTPEYPLRSEALTTVGPVQFNQE